MNQEPPIRIVDLTTYYIATNAGKENAVLKGFSLSVEAGQLVLIVGPSGCGKTTLAYCIKGVIPVQIESETQGDVEVCGLNTRASSPTELATKVGMVFQDPESQLCNLYLEDEVAFGMENMKLDAQTVWERVDRELALVCLNGPRFSERFVHELSGGEKQRLAIASVLAMGPGILIFDEPSANLDPQGAREIFKAIIDLHEQGYTILVVEHRFDELIGVADRLIVMDEGKIAYDGEPRKLLATHGKTLRDEHGLWLPQISDVAVMLEDEFQWKEFPLSVPEMKAEIQDKIRSLSHSVQHSCDLTDEERRRFENVEDAVQVKDVGYRYPNGTLGLEGVTFNIKRGETVGIAGTNGSGKTTLGKMLVGLYKPSTGSAQVCGMDIGKTPMRAITRKVGYVFQYPEHQFLKENVFDEVAYGLQVHGYELDDVEQRTSEILQLFNLTNFRDRQPLALSGGQKRRLSVATVLVLDPEILILDEPTFGQDRENTRRMVEYLLQRFVQKRNTTTILITHDMDLLALYCDRTLIFSDGKLVFNGSPGELFRTPDILAKGSLNNLPLCELIESLNEDGCQIPNFIRVRDFVDWYHQVM